MTFKMLSLAATMLYCNLIIAQETKPKSHFAIAANLIQITEDNVGFGLNYEQFLNSSSTVSLYLPFSYALPVNKYSNPSAGEDYYEYNINRQFGPSSIPLHYDWTNAKGMAYFYPGIKFYTGKKLSRVSYCLGASLLVGVGQSEYTSIDYAVDTLSVTQDYLYYRRRETNHTTETLTRLKLGAMITNAINFRMGKHIYSGLEAGIGYTYLNKEGNNNIQRGVLAQMGLKLGYHK